jgi:integrase
MMPRPPLPLGTYGKIKTWKEGKTWLARAQFRDFDGIVRPVKRSAETKAAAERKLKTALADHQMPVKQSEITAQTKIEKVAELWLAEIERAVDGGSKSPSTLDTYRTIYRRHVKPALGALRVREVNTPVVDRVLAAIKHKTVSGARTAKIVISGLMRLAARHGAVTINPVRETARIEGTPRRRPRALTAQERQQWLAALEASKPARRWDLPDLSLMMLATGCRIGECLAIGWEEIDLDNASVEICWRLVRQTGVGLLRLPSTKSGKSGERVSRYQAGL